MKFGTLSRCKRVDVRIANGERLVAACKAERTNWSTYKNYIKKRDAGEITQDEETPAIEVHHMRADAGVARRKYKAKESRSGKCIVVITETINLRSVVEGLL
jgi:hypothetical protein